MPDQLHCDHETTNLVDHAEKPVNKIIKEIEQEMLNLSQLLSDRVASNPANTKPFFTTNLRTKVTTSAPPSLAL